MGLFTFLKRKPAAPPPAPHTDNGYRPPVPLHAEPRGIVPAITKLLPIGRIVDQVAGIIRDPNGKLSSRRAGAGALVVAGITFLDAGRHFEAITCLVFASFLFLLVKWPGTDQDPNA